MWLYFPVYCTIQGFICQRTHDIYCSEAQPRSIFMCPRTNNPLQCTVDWEIKLLVHTQSCIPIGPELDVIIQGGNNAPNQALYPSKIRSPRIFLQLILFINFQHMLFLLRCEYRDIFPSSRPIGIEDFRQMCTNGFKLSFGNVGS